MKLSITHTTQYDYDAPVDYALQQVADNAALNNCDHVETLLGSAFDVLKQLRDEGRRFDVVIVDPPAFIPRKKDHKEGLQAYRRINELAMRLLENREVVGKAVVTMNGYTYSP